MTLQQVDEALAYWNNRLAAIAEDLLELQADPTYQVLTGGGGRSAPRLEGLTAARVGPALGAMLLFHEQFAVLRSTLEKAAQMRASVPRIFGAEGRLAQLQQLLNGRSVDAPGAAGRGRVSLGELQHAMLGIFSGAREAVQGVSGGWNALGLRMDEAQARIAELSRPPQNGAGQNGTGQDLDRQVMLGGAAHLLQAIRAKVGVDPLGAAAEFEQQMQPLLARVSAMAARAEERQRKMVDARRLCEELVELQKRTQAALAEARVKVADCDGLPAPVADETLAGLRDWLERLQARQADGPSEAVERGLRNWRAAAEECAAKARSGLAACRAPLEQRHELRGRLEALKSKARVYGVAELSAMAELAREAETTLHRQPSDLGRAISLISAYEKTLQMTRKETIRR